MVLTLLRYTNAASLCAPPSQEAVSQESSAYVVSSQQAARLQELQGLADRLQAQLDRVNAQQLALR
jgi:hypothetical protein